MEVGEGTRKGLISGATLAAAICVGAALADASSFPPIVPALGASLILAALELGLGVDSPHARFRAGFDIAAEWIAAFASGAILLAVVGLTLPKGATFVCEPLVPWRISIAIFGAFFSAWIVAAMSVRAGDKHRQPLLRLMLLWIAPFYGFFHAPWFLAQTVTLPCADHPISQAIVAALAMVVSSYGGQWLGTWMFAQPPPQ